MALAKFKERRVGTRENLESASTTTLVLIGGRQVKRKSGKKREIRRQMIRGIIHKK